VPAGNRWIVTGKFTADGANAWRRGDGTWSRRFHEVGLFVDETSARAVLPAAAAEQRVITDPYIVDVLVEGATIAPSSARERIRATGPTVPIRRPDEGVTRRR